MGLEMNVEQFGISSVAIDLGGTLDAYTAFDFRESLQELVRNGKKAVLINLLGVTFLDSVGLGMLFEQFRRITELGGTTSLVVADPVISNVLDITGISRTIHVYKTREAAVKEMFPLETTANVSSAV